MNALIQKIFAKDIWQIQAAHAVRVAALSFVAVYVPIYFFTLGYDLVEIIWFYIVLHGGGLLFLLLVIVPLMRKYHLVHVMRLSYPLDILALILVYHVQTISAPLFAVALIAGFASFTYWPLFNILFINKTEDKDISKNLGTFFALPELFRFVGPLVGAVIVLYYDFWPLFVIAGGGLLASYYFLHGLTLKKNISLDFWKGVTEFRRRKKVFLLEIFDNILEESEWFWPIYVFLIIGALEAPGIISALSAAGAGFFALWVGKKDTKSMPLLIVITAVGLALLWMLRFFVVDVHSAYAVTLLVSFFMAGFLVAYFSHIFKIVKNDREAEFMILREITTVSGRLIVFATILFFAAHPQNLFFLPILAIFVMCILLQLSKKGSRSLFS